MSDLISRSALIEDIKNIGYKVDLSEIPNIMSVSKLIENVVHNVAEIVMEHIENQPTAYDVEKVVAELEYNKEQCEKDSEYWMEHPWRDRDVFNEYDVCNKKAECYEESIDIVKRGGVE